MLAKLIVIFSLIALAVAQVPGGYTQQNLPLAEPYKNIVNFAMAGLGNAINAAGEFALVSVNFFATQVVAGVNYYFEVIVNHSTETSSQVSRQTEQIDHLTL